ncbi:endonuclease/exonuclease/phosphatase family protein [Stieleria varia]|uniref:Endonuclease/Exonuclease/phosphatase family protein n=1 Tax=Stieleria varia TaxID=2528005 RepID=A0A5C6B5U1_9BACT|nr:endonuclease/exonuclease/phosphatase family protein [Stieleria varia]TWU07473.1 Endonuclease/Exonuclease/phosphatase family protein [Stieleria varia]
MGIFSKRRRRKQNDSTLGKLPFLRWLGPGATSAAVIAVAYMAVTGKWDFSILDTFRGSDDVVRLEPISLGNRSERPPESIRVATFNIKTFGESKSSSQEVMQQIAQIVYRFDVIAIQEVRSSDGEGTPIRRLVDLINASGGQYAATLSDPIGTDGYKECYAFLWDESRVRMIPDSAYVVFDSTNRITREPMVASFEARLPPGDMRRPFRFTAINAHTKPDLVNPSSPDGEINVLDDVFVRVRDYESQVAGEDDIILLGDLNVNSKNLGELATIPNVHSIAGDLPTNTRRTETYDHILIDYDVTREFTQAYGILDLQKDLQLTEEQALLISDHMPVFADFSRYEVPLTRTATRPLPVIR